MDDFEKFYNLVLRFLSFRPRSIKEVSDYLTKKKAPKEVQQGIIDKLKEYKFLDDDVFARMWIQERIKLKPKAWRVIKSELKQKGISDEIIEFIIHDSEFIIHSDFQMAFSIAQKRKDRYKNLSRQEFFEKMGRYLASKGFNYDTIKEVINKIN